MTRQRYSKKEALNRILRSLQGDEIGSDAPNTLPGEDLSEDEAVSDIAEMLLNSLPNEAGVIPFGLRNRPAAYGDSKDFFVIPDHANASDSNSGENPAHPLATIQQAVTNSRAYHGDVIWVTSSDSWQYGAQSEDGVVENVVIPATKPGIALVGVGRGPMGTYWTPATEASGSFCLEIRALDVIVDGFCFWGAGAGNGIFCNWDSPTYYGENTIIHNCTFADGLDIAIQMEYAWFCDIVNNHFQECDTYAIFSDPNGDGTSYTKIRNNWFNDCAVAIAIDQSDNSLIESNYFFQTDAQATGSCTNLGINTSNGDYNIIANNYFAMPLSVYDDFNSAAATDGWINNHFVDGSPTANPA